MVVFANDDQFPGQTTFDGTLFMLLTVTRRSKGTVIVGNSVSDLNIMILYIMFINIHNYII